MKDIQKMMMRVIIAWTLVFYLGSGIAAAETVLFSDITSGSTNFAIKCENDLGISNTFPRGATEIMMVNKTEPLPGPLTLMPVLPVIPLPSMHAYEFFGSITIRKGNDVLFHKNFSYTVSQGPFPTVLLYLDDDRGHSVPPGHTLEISGTIINLAPGFPRTGPAQIIIK